MRKIFTTLGIAIALFLLASIAIHALSTPAAPTYYETQQQQQALDMAAQVRPAWVIASYVLIVGIPLMILAAGGLLLYRFLYRTRLATPDAYGRLPLHLGDAQYQDRADRALAAYHTTEHARASIAPVPTHYSPSTTYSPNLSRAITASAPQQLVSNDAVLALPDGVPTFAEMLDSGRIGKGRPMVIGFDTEGQAIELSFKSLFSAGVGGLQGSGKTSTTINIVAQSVLSGARLVICDLHAGDEESLATRLEPLSAALLFGVADTTKSIMAAVRNVDDMLTRRKDGGRDRSLIILAFDEYTSTVRRLGKDAEAMSAMIANLTSEGRKYGIFCLLLAQNWSSESTGGSEVRNTLASALIHRIRPAEARMLTGMTAADLPSDTLRLAPGEFYLLDTHGDMTKVAAPRITAADVTRVAGLLTDNAPTMARVRPPSPTASPDPLLMAMLNVPEAATEVGNEGESGLPLRTLSTAIDAGRIERVRALVRSGTLPSEIIAQEWQVKGGDKYKLAARELASIMAQLVGGAA